MVSPELVLLDVAHGNCAVILSSVTAAIVDAPRGGLHIDALKARERVEVHAVVISHADADHMSGVTHLLYDEDVHVHAVYVNGDATKTSAGGGLIWESFAIALADAERRGVTRVEAIKRGDTVDLPDDGVRLEILAPPTALVLLSAGGRTGGEPLTSNALSVVVRVWFGAEPVALLTGDLDDLGLRKLLDEGDDLHARVMVFPHHGGHSGGDDETFAASISQAVRPDFVVFSFGREQFDNPRPEIIRGTRAGSPEATIACTQLSRACSPDSLDPLHLAPLPAQGRNLGRCCAGSLLFEATGLREPIADDHARFVEGSVPTPLCMRATD